MSKPLLPVTPQSIAEAKAACEAERQDAIAQSGGAIRFREDGRIELAEQDEINAIREKARFQVRQFPRVALPIPSSKLTRAQQDKLQDAVDTLVERYSLAEVQRAVRLVVEANGR